MSILMIVLIILIPITTILIILAFIMAKRFFKINKRKGMLENISKTMRLERMSKADAIISRVKVVISGNPEYKIMFKDLETNYGKMFDRVETVNASYEDLVSNVLKLSKNEFLKIYKRVIIDIESLDSIETKFIKISSQITQQDEFLTSEHVFYSSHLREAIEIYRKKRILLDKISRKLDNLTEKIKDQGNLFKKALDSARNTEASEHLRRYANLVNKFISVVAEAPKIETYIYNTIPKVITSLTTTYKNKKAELGSPLAHINFKEQLISMSKLFNNAKVAYKDLNMDLTKQLIKKILKSVKALERLINYEIVSRNFFITNYEITIDETKASLQRYISLKKQIKSILGKGHVISPDLSAHLNDANMMSSQIDNMALQFRDSMKDKTIPYSSKISRMKNLLNKNLIFSDKMNEILQHLWSVNIESSIIKNKFRKSETAINEVLANMKKQNVSLTIEQKENYEAISRKINIVAKSIESQTINKEVQTSVDELMRETTSFYNIVGGNVQIAEISSNLIKDLAPKRVANQKLNIALNSAEKSYLEGRYAHSLNTIITEIEQGGK